MNSRLSRFLLCIMLAFSSHKVMPKALYASELNNSYSCIQPLVLTESTLIKLDEDIIFDGCVPFIASLVLDNQATVTFTSTASHKIIIKAGTIFDISSFLPDGQSILLSGNVLLMVEQGATIIYAENRIIVTDNAQIIFAKSAP